MRRINAAGFELLKKLESCRLMAYKDIGGVLTIGYGHTGPEVKEDSIITQSEADELLQKDLEKFYHLDNYVSEQVNDNQYAALICLTYNIGLRAMKTSGVLRIVNDGEDPTDEWMKWNKVKGMVVNGLTKRRKQELELYHAIG